MKQTNTVITAIFVYIKPDTNFNKKKTKQTTGIFKYINQGGFVESLKIYFIVSAASFFKQSVNVALKQRNPLSMADGYNASFCAFFSSADIRGVRSSLIQEALGTKSKNSGGLCYPNGAEAMRGQCKPYIMCHLINRSGRCTIISNYRFTSDMTLHHGCYITYLWVWGQ